MIRLFIDTDVVLDFLLARQPFDQEARALWLAHEQSRAWYLFHQLRSSTSSILCEKPKERL